jgi:AraC family transcriptional regulator, transcriptional activator of pobA
MDHSTILEYHLNRHKPDKMQFAMYDLRLYLNRHHSDVTKPHIHSYYQIIWFKRAGGKHFVDFKEYAVFDNTIFFIGKNQVHYFDSNKDCEGILIHFNESFFVQKNGEMDFFLKFNIFNNSYQQPPCRMSKVIDDILNEYIIQIKRELETSEEFAKSELLRSYLKLFLIQVQRNKKDCKSVVANNAFLVDQKRNYLMKFANLVDENYTKGYAVIEYARLLSISPKSLSDLTRQLINKTPLQMIQDRIILEAQRLLLHSNLNVNQVGYHLGFNDPSYFVKFFKKHTSSSPLAFRKSALNISRVSATDRFS